MHLGRDLGTRPHARCWAARCQRCTSRSCVHGRHLCAFGWSLGLSAGGERDMEKTKIGCRTRSRLLLAGGRPGIGLRSGSRVDRLGEPPSHFGAKSIMVLCGTEGSNVGLVREHHFGVERVTLSSYPRAGAAASTAHGRVRWGAGAGTPPAIFCATTRLDLRAAQTQH